MPSSTRRLPLVLALLAGLGVIAYVVFGNPFGPKGDGADGVRVGQEAPDAVNVDEKDKASEVAGSDSAKLATGFDAVGQGELTLRLLLFKDKNPIVGQPVLLTSTAGERLERPTGDDGRVLFTGVRARRDWTLSIEGKGFATVEMKGVAVRARALTDLGDLMLGEKAVLRGRVIDAKGMPLPGTSVSAYVGGGLDASQGFALAIVSSALSFPTPTEETKTDEKGTFTLAALTPGTSYEVQARRAGNAFSVQSGIVVTPDRASAVLTIVLGLGATVKGKVVDDAGHGLANAIVIALEDGGGRFSTTIKKDYAKTKADGTYVLDTLTRGMRYRFGVQAPGYAPVFDGLNAGTTVEIEMTRDFTLLKGGAIEGRVTDKSTGKPIRDARVVAIVGNLQMMPGGRGGRNTPGAGPAPGEDVAATQITTTGEDGRFRLEGLKPGPVALAQVKATGFSDFQASRFPGGGEAWGEVRAGETLNQDVALESGGSVTGKVMAVTPQGMVPLAGAQVAVVSMMSMFTGYPTAVSGEDGSYRIDGVKAGSSFQVTAVAAGYVSPGFTDPSTSISMPESGGVVTKDLTMSAAGAVEGVVTNSKGVAVSGARVRTKSAPVSGGRGGFGASTFRQFLPGGGGGNVLTDAEGRFRIESVPSDERMVVEVDTDEYVSGESEAFTVRTGETKETKVVLEGGARLRGRVIDDHGSIVAGAKLRIGHLDEANAASANLVGRRADSLLEQRVLSSDADGTYEIDRIRSGRTLMKVEKDGYTTYYRRDLDFKPDEVRENHVITLAKGETIGGVVKGEDGKPIAGAFVAVTKQENPTRGFGGGGSTAAASTTSDGTVEASMDDRCDDQGRFTVENVPAGSYTVVVWFANGFQGYGAGDDTAIKRAVPTGSKDVEFVLKKLPEGSTGFPIPGGGGPRPAGGGMGGFPGMGGAPPAMGG